MPDHWGYACSIFLECAADGVLKLVLILPLSMQVYKLTASTSENAASIKLAFQINRTRKYTKFNGLEIFMNDNYRDPMRLEKIFI